MLQVIEKDPPTKHAPPATAAIPRSLRVLVIDDDRADVELTLDALAAMPWFRADATVRSTYADGLDALRAGMYDVVLLDFQLGPNTGLDLIREAFGDTVGVPVVLLTGAVDHRIDEAATRAGIAYLLEKSALDAPRLERSLRFALERMRCESELRRTRAFFRAAFGSLTDHVAILSDDGTILVTNDKWTRFAAENRYAGGRAGVGMNYLTVCDTASGPASEGAGEVARGIRDVMQGTRQSFTHEYPCHAPSHERWFVLKVSRFDDDGKTRILVAHENITARRVTESALRQSEERHRLVAAAMRELIWDLDVASGRVVRGGATRELLGEAPPDSTTEWWQERIHPEDRRGVRESLANALVGRSTHWYSEYRFQRGDGELRYLSDHGYIVRDVHGTATRVVGTTVDVTMRRQAELEKRASEGRYRTLIETAHEGVCTLDGVGCVTYANPRVAAMLGYAPDELLGRSLFDFIPEEHQFTARRRFARRDRGVAETDEIQLRGADGSTPWMLACSNRIVDEEGRFAGVLVMLTDVTARKHAELAMAEALRAADLDRRRLEATLDAIPLGVWLSDATGRLTHSNPAAQDIWGGQAPQATGVTEYGMNRAWSATTGAPLAPGDWALPRTLTTGQPISNELLEIERFDGARAFILNSAAAIRDAEGRITGGVVVNVDVSERQAEVRERERLLEQLEVERTHLAAVFEQAPAFLAVLRGPRHVFERVNAAYVRLVGDRELLGKPLIEAIPEMAEQSIAVRLDQVWETGVAFVGENMPTVIVREPGGASETRFVTVVCQRLTDHTGEHVIVLHGWDATAQVLATQELKRNEQQLREQFDKLPVPTHLWELEGKDFVLLEANEAASRMSPDIRSAIGKRGRDIYADLDEGVAPDMKRCLRENIVVRRSLTHDFGGSLGVRHFELSFGPQPPNRVLVHAVDTTERLALEMQLRQAQKMEAVGQLAGGVAHDFNNLLTVIGAHSSFLLESLGAEDPQREDALAIHEASFRAAGLTRQLLTFSRKQLLRPVIMDLNAVVAETSKMLARLIGDETHLDVSLAPDLGLVLADPGHIDQVVMNLTLNGRDAMPHGGRLSITTCAVDTAGDADGTTSGIPAGEYVLLEVQDTGIGMDARTKARLFEPFFTTKAPGQGTGLGLATVHGIVKQSNGHLLVESEPGKGATFRVYLPRISDGEPATKPPVTASPGARGTETVLLIEDEACVRDIATRVLRAHGYHVLEAGNGFEALGLASTFAAPIHLVLSDAAMPGMTGGETFRRLRELRPGLRVVFMSGYTDDEVLRRGVVLTNVAFVEKPFDPAELVRVVRATLDS